MNPKKDNVLDINEEFWDLTDDKVIWDGVPNINENLYVGLLLFPILVMLVLGFLIYTYAIEFEIIFIIFPITIFIASTIIFSIYDYYKKWRKTKYVLLSKYLVIRAGNKLTTKGFRFTSIEDVQNKEGSRYVSIILKNKILHPFAFYRYRTNEIKIGPFDNAEGVADILKDYILNTEVDYTKIVKKRGVNPAEWNDTKELTLWEEKPMLEDSLYSNLRNAIGILVLSILILFVFKTYLGFMVAGLLVMMFYLLIFLAIVWYQLKRIRAKSFYCLQKEYLIIRAGYRLINIRFELVGIRDIHLVDKKNKLKINLNKKIRHPFKFVRDWTNNVEIGPFENPEEVLEVIERQINEVKK